jgi:phosphoglycolate phosphatase-like HAD superfamily hydrolase
LVKSTLRTLLIDLDGTLTDPKPGITNSAMQSNSWDIRRQPPMI